MTDTKNRKVLTLTLPEFRKMFPDIEAGINWKRFEAEHWPVEHFVITERAELARFHTFFRHSLGRINGHFLHWIGERKMPINEVMNKLSRVPEPDISSIRYFARKFAEANAPVRLCVPTFALPNGGEYIMDLNHRLCGLALSDRPFVIDVYSVRGPLEADALKDAVLCG